MNRPDLSMARGTTFTEKGIDLEQNYDNVRNGNGTTPPPPQQRPEMRGPQSSQANDILSKFNLQPTTLRRQNLVMTPNNQFLQQQMPQQQSQIKQPPHTQFNTPSQLSTPVSVLKEEFKELNMANIDEMSATSFNISKEDNISINDNISILSGDDSYIGSSGGKTPAKRGRKPKQQSEKNRISIDI
jgi:hypothetical protein